MWRIGGILIVLWLFAFFSHVGGAWGPPLLAVATVVFLASFLMKYDPQSRWL